MTDALTDLAGRVLYEDNHLIAINKRPSEIVQGDKTGDQPLSEVVKAYLVKKYQKPGDAYLGVMHRIDRPVSGVVMFAKTSKALTRMNQMMQQKQMNKRYWAVVRNLPDPVSASLVHHLKKNEKQNKSYVVEAHSSGAKEASLTYRLLASGHHYHLLEVDLHTGRHHQIRTQLSFIGSPIRGDLKYGYPRSNGDGSIHLHARSVSFTHPVSQEAISIVAPAPHHDAVWTFFNDILR